jgi:aspartyl-tRNA(Asn)/glutamyl-tRNA(Gln) amidotransferase subunit B
MEVHAQVLTRSKMFCRCATDYQGAPPNTRTCPTCLALPGALPVINRAAVEATIRTGLALHRQINPSAVFARKNYTYPDLPKGYQISQYELPLCEHGFLEIEPGRRLDPPRAHPPRPSRRSTGRSVHTGAPPTSTSTGPVSR